VPGMKKPMGLVLLIVVVLTTVELFVIARMVTGTFDPRCLLPRGYIVAHRYTKGKEATRCIPDTP
jgi:hypothetical protein